jgi:DnaJ-class molecular chaperone
MRQVKKPKPAGACNVCRAPTELHETLNHRCDSVLNGRRCYGTYHSDLSLIWDECQSCNGSGKVGTRPCSACAGFGWTLFA